MTNWKKFEKHLLTEVYLFKKQACAFMKENSKAGSEFAGSVDLSSDNLFATVIALTNFFNLLKGRASLCIMILLISLLFANRILWF